MGKYGKDLDRHRLKGSFVTFLFGIPDLSIIRSLPRLPNVRQGTHSSFVYRVKPVSFLSNLLCLYFLV